MLLNVLADFREEEWPSMDLVAEMLVAAASEQHDVRARLVRPAMWRLRRQRLTAARRVMGRFVQYPLAVLGLKRSTGVFHVADHSYAHLVHALPAERTGVYCHDIDAFRVLFQKKRTLNWAARAAMAKLQLEGLRRAAVVFHSTMNVRAELLERGLIDAARLVHAPYGISPEFSPQATELDARVRERYGQGYLLHVGSCIARKNTAFLLRLLAELRREFPRLQLVQVGGEWGGEQREIIRSEHLERHVLQVRGISRLELAAIYRQAALVLSPSTAEGFGLPLVEALASGATTVASELPVFREVGGAAVIYAAVSDPSAWLGVLRSLLTGSHEAPPLEVKLERASRYSWSRHSSTIVSEYRRVLGERVGVE